MSGVGEMSKENQYTGMLNKAMRNLLWDGLRISIPNNPGFALFAFKAVRAHREAQKLRMQWEEKGVHVPPYMIASITKKCNLNCKGCYAQVHHNTSGGEMSEETLRSLVAESKELGISFILLAGGEPLFRGEILDMAANYPEILFPIFTNGLLIDDAMIQKFKKLRNVIPVISLEGYKGDTDSRRGEGVYEHTREVMRKLEKSNIFYGTSLTITSQNFDTVTGEEFVKELAELKCKVFFFVEYVPVKEGTEDLLPTEKQRAGMTDLVRTLRSRFHALFIVFPGDEEKYGGCMSAGRGFVHVGPDGSIEPCPFAPYSDSNLTDTSLKAALQSDFLKAIRQNHHELVETSGGCALWEKREWVQSLLAKK